MRLLTLFIALFIFKCILNLVSHTPNTHDVSLHSTKLRSHSLYARRFLINKSDLTYSTKLDSALFPLSKIILLSIALISFLYNMLLAISRSVSYIPFDTNLSTCKREKNAPYLSVIWSHLAFCFFLVFVIESPHFMLLVTQSPFPFLDIFNFLLRKSLRYKVLFLQKSIMLKFRNYTYLKIHSFCIVSFKCLIHFTFSAVSSLDIPCAILWYYQLVISLSNDISKNPGPSVSRPISDPIAPYFTFCNWNVNA